MKLANIIYLVLFASLIAQAAEEKQPESAGGSAAQAKPARSVEDQKKLDQELINAVLGNYEQYDPRLRERKRFEAVQAAIDRGADINAEVTLPPNFRRCGKIVQMPLIFYPAYVKDLQIIKLLIHFHKQLIKRGQKGLNRSCKQKDCKGSIFSALAEGLQDYSLRPWMTAQEEVQNRISFDYKTAVNLLIKYGFTIESADVENALLFDNLELAKALLMHVVHISPNILLNWILSESFRIAVRDKPLEQVIKVIYILLDTGANFNLRTPWDTKPLRSWHWKSHLKFDRANKTIIEVLQQLREITIDSEMPQEAEKYQQIIEAIKNYAQIQEDRSRAIATALTKTEQRGEVTGYLPPELVAIIQELATRQIQKKLTHTQAQRPRVAGRTRQLPQRKKLPKFTMPAGIPSIIQNQQALIIEPAQRPGGAAATVSSKP